MKYEKMLNRKEFYDSLQENEKEMFDFYMQKPSPFTNAVNILEIGSGWGLFTRIALEFNPEIKVTTIDKVKDLPTFKKNTDGFEDRITRMVGDSKELLKKITDKSFDVVYVDGDHGYQGFGTDFQEAWRICKDDGYVLIDDVLHRNNYKDDYGVMKRLSEILLENKHLCFIKPVGNGLAILYKGEV